MQKIKIIEFFGEPLNYGGQEAFIINLYSKIDANKYEFTFITPFECQNTKLKEMIKEKNDNLIVEDKEFETKLRKKHIISTAKKMLNNSYDVIHIHSGSVFTLYNVAKIAKKSGIKKVIVHSHATGENTFKYKLIKFISDLSIDKYVDYYFACSKEAGIWKFPKHIINSKKFYIIKNGIDIDRFTFDSKIRNQYRKEYKIENKNVICTIGRYAKEKNPLFTLETFNNYLKLDKNGFLVMIGGGGELEEKIYRYIKDEKIEGNVMILKNRSDINNLLSMSDIYIMPSLWEGLGIAAIEAQAAGIPIICSENIPEDVNLTSLFHRKMLSDGAESWAQTIYKLVEKNERKDEKNKIKKSGFDISASVLKVEEIYAQNGKENNEKNN